MLLGGYRESGYGREGASAFEERDRRLRQKLGTLPLGMALDIVEIIE